MKDFSYSDISDNIIIVDVANRENTDKEKIKNLISQAIEEKKEQYKDFEIKNWNVNLDKIRSLEYSSISRKNSIEECIDIEIVQYALETKEEKLYFSDFKSAEDFKKENKIATEVITLNSINEIKVTSQAELDNAAQKQKSLLETQRIAKLTSRSGTNRREVNNTSQSENVGVYGIQPCSYKLITSQYRGNRKNHTGVDLANDINTHIKAFQSGIVTDIGWRGGYGNMITITHSNGIVTRYAHLNSFNVSNGQVVNQGEVIGFMGSTGNSTGPHLHFEIMINGDFVNPLNYIK